MLAHQALCALFLFLNVFACTTLLVAKTVVYGWTPTVEHYTNYMLTLLTLTLWSMVCFWRSNHAYAYCTVRTSATLLAAIGPAAHANVWFVCIGVFAIFGTDPSFFLDMIDASATPAAAGLLLVGNCVVHVVPVALVILVMCIFGPIVRFSFRHTFSRLYSRNAIAAYVLYALVLSPLVPYGLYMIVVQGDIARVYDTALSPWLALPTIVGVSLVVNGLPLLYLYSYTQSFDDNDGLDVYYEGLAGMHTEKEILTSAGIAEQRNDFKRFVKSAVRLLERGDVDARHWQ